MRCAARKLSARLGPAQRVIPERDLRCSPSSSFPGSTPKSGFAHVAQASDAQLGCHLRARRGHSRSFSSLGAFRTSGYNVASADGRSAPAAGALDVVVIGHSLWSSRFGQDPDLLGRSIRIGRNLHVVVGVMPDGFTFPTNEALWLPLRLTSTSGLKERMRVQVLGRLADGASAQQAQAEGVRSRAVGDVLPHGAPVKTRRRR